MDEEVFNQVGIPNTLKALLMLASFHKDGQILVNSFFPTLSVLHEQRSSLMFVNLSRIFPRQEVLCGNCSLTGKGRVALWESV